MKAKDIELKIKQAEYEAYKEKRKYDKMIKEHPNCPYTRSLQVRMAGKWASLFDLMKDLKFSCIQLEDEE